MAWWQHPVPNLVTDVPGRRSRQIIERDNACTSPSYTRDFPLVADEARGAAVRDMDGNVFLDFAAGIAVCATGHCHPEVVRAIQEQAEKLIHICTADFYSEPVMQLAEKLCTLAPGDSPKRIFFCNSGTEANEAAIKLARYATGRPNILAFLGGFHGRTMGTMSLTASKTRQREGFGPFLPGVLHAPYPNPYRPPYGVSPDRLTDSIFHYIEETIFKRMCAPEEVAAVFIEPMQGEGGYVSPPDDFLPRLKSLARFHGILLVVDEVQSGMGRTGQFFAVEHTGVEPDILTLSKGIASGLPLGALISRSEIMSWKPGAHANTLGGNPVACAASLATIRLLEQGLVQNAAETGAYLLSRLQALQPEFEVIGNVRGRGLMVGVEVIHPDSGLPYPALRDKILRRCFNLGLLILGCGESTIRFCPPLIVQKGEVDKALSILKDAIQSCR